MLRLNAFCCVKNEMSRLNSFFFFFFFFFFFVCVCVCVCAHTPIVPWCISSNGRRRDLTRLLARLNKLCPRVDSRALPYFTVAVSVTICVIVVLLFAVLSVPNNEC